MLGMMSLAQAVARPFPFPAPALRAAPQRAWMTDLATATDRELARAARRGEPGAIAALVERYSPRLHRYLAHLVSEPALAEDLLQESWLRVVERLNQYNPAQPFAAWLFAVARHCAIDALRQRARQARLLGRRAEPWEDEEGQWQEPLDAVAGAEPSPLEAASAQQTYDRVARVFATLPRHYREALALRFQEELSLEEVADLLEVPLSTAKTRVQRGLALLRQRVEGAGLTDNA